MESHKQFSKALNDFKSLRIDTTDDDIHKIDSMFQLPQFLNNCRAAKLAFENMMKRNETVFKLMNDLKAQRTVAGCDTAKIEELFKECKYLKLAYNEYGINNHEGLGLFDRLCKLNSKIELFLEEMMME